MASSAADLVRHLPEFDLDAGLVALDFANTLDGRYGLDPQDQLRSYRDLLAFGVQSATLDEATADRLARLADEVPDAAERQLEHAKTLREAIFSVASAVADGRLPDHDDVSKLNAFHQRAMSRGRISASASGFEWGWEDDDTLDRPLWPLVRSAVDLLLTGDRRRLRECAADDCGWLFYDTSRNQSRRWCSMQTCGNRAKVQQFRERKKNE